MKKSDPVTTDRKMNIDSEQGGIKDKTPDRVTKDDQKKPGPRNVKSK